MSNRTRLVVAEQCQVGGRAVSRRSCLLGWLLGATGLKAMELTAQSAWADGAAEEAKTIAQVQAAAKKAGLEPFRTGNTPHFLGLGDAPDRYRGKALDICEELSKAFLAYFKSRGFKLALPEAHLTVITLKDDDSFRAFIGADPGDDVGGHYDLETNHLVVFDFRDKKLNQPANAERVNLFSLIHETAHLLCFNTGLLSRKADVPVCISEGLATFVEMWRPGQKTSLSSINRPRLQALVEASDGPESWIPIAELLADDDRVQGPKSHQLAYAESWLLVHYLIKTPAQLPKFQAYLSDLPEGDQTAEQRVKYAKEHLGSLDKLDRDLQRYAKSLIRK
jgi:hypothetical protein